MIVSEMAENLVGSEIIKLANEINEKIRGGANIFNLTIGDFNPEIFPIPAKFEEEIKKAYESHKTNYPSANGILELRKAVSALLSKHGGIEYSPEEILIAGGGRPLIYAIFQVILDPGDTVLYPVPSWNNNHYSHLTRVKNIQVETKAEDNFMPTADQIKPHIHDVNLIALCSPLNPTGTTFSRKNLASICDLIIEENKKRGPNKKPVYLLFDQIYWQLTFGKTTHHNPVVIRPEMREYTLFIDGMSKAYAATGVRIGWGFGPKKVINKMKAILGHLGAWAPKAEQVGAANFLMDEEATDTFSKDFRARLKKRLDAFYEGFKTLKSMGHPVDAIAPQAAMYLTVKLDLTGMKTTEGKLLKTIEDVTKHLLDEAKIALVPFYAFGAEKDSSWYRLSVGTASMQDIESFFESLRNMLTRLSK
ncbi:MAG: aminotransferase [Bacteroidetes bacterium]|nr:MAG: aminotransferase [Bacteroidota bacterium]